MSASTLAPELTRPLNTRKNRNAVPTRRAPRRAAELLELYVLADRARLWATIAPGLGHHLANVLMSLSAFRQEPEMVQHMQSRLERAHHVLDAMSQGRTCAWPVSIATVLEDLDAWHRLQLSLPRAELRFEIAADLPVVDGGTTRLHHAMLTLVTLAKECRAENIEVRAYRADGEAVLELQLPVGDADSPERRRRLEVVEYLVAGLGGRVEMGVGGWLRLRLPEWKRQAAR